MTMGLDEITTELRVMAPLDISGHTRPRVIPEPSTLNP